MEEVDMEEEEAANTEAVVVVDTEEAVDMVEEATKRVKPWKYIRIITNHQVSDTTKSHKRSKIP
ncbi:unnamed protein product [Larinioides sclopetarius]|uniref:Uncharacterized protein n=1 Tax=Larinioides sclopetarius TaxID=280406 RepID=A0AAV2AF47_9ARAC